MGDTQSHSGKLNGLMMRTTPFGSLYMTGRMNIQFIASGGFSGLAQESTFLYASMSSAMELLISRLCK
jgi:hypothetical protein